MKTRNSLIISMVCLAILWAGQVKAQDESFRALGGPLQISIGQVYSAGVSTTDPWMAYSSKPKIAKVEFFGTQDDFEQYITITGIANGECLVTIQDAYGLYSQIAVIVGTGEPEPILELTPYYRFWSPANRDHFYTTDKDEMEYLKVNPQIGYNYEGIVGYVYVEVID